MRTPRWIPLLLVAVLPLAACDGQDEDFNDAPAAEEFPDMPDATPAPPPAVDDPAPAEEGVAARQITVTNPMPHPMIVTATIDGETIELGTVPADETEQFTVRARSGANVQIEARDQPDTHRLQTTVTVGETAVEWTIRQ